jgi:hypothetical protein
MTNIDYLHAHYKPVALDMKIRCGLQFSGMLGAVDLYFVQKTNLSRKAFKKSEDFNYTLTEALNRAVPDVSAASRTNTLLEIKA